MNALFKTGWAGLLKAGAAFVTAIVLIMIVLMYDCTETSQIGFDGVAMQVTDSRERMADRLAHNELPPAAPLVVPEGDPLAADVYQNVQVLGHLPQSQFIRLMNSMNTWLGVGCAYCHNLENLAEDSIYTKVVSRRMIQMTQHLNENWQRHVKKTGVNCYTCHRGMAVPQYIWFNQPEDTQPGALLGYRAEQNRAYMPAGTTSLPSTAFEQFLLQDTEIRVQDDSALPEDNDSSIKQTEWTYSLMMHFSRALGVNCTYCHNSRSWADWSQSPLTRTNAWHGIRMVRHLNNDWLVPLTDVFPDKRLGPTGDGPKLNCSTCHQGAYKPLLGQSMLPDFPSLAKAMPQPKKSDDAGGTPSAAGAP